MLLELLFKPQYSDEELQEAAKRFKRQGLNYLFLHNLCHAAFWLIALGGTAVFIYYLPSLREGKPFGQQEFITGAVLWLFTVVTIRRVFFKLLPLEQKYRFYSAVSDPRPPVLYLRSFSQERRANRSHSYAEKTFEEQIVRVLGDLGPVVTVGDRAEIIPPSGAARLFFKAEEWQTRVRQLMSLARLVVINPGQTRGVVWEMATALQEMPPEKLLVTFSSKPRNKPQYFFVRSSVNSRLRSGLDSPLPPAIPDDTLFLYFEPDWAPRLIRNWRTGLTSNMHTALRWVSPSVATSLTLRKLIGPIFRRYGKSPRYGRALAARLLLLSFLAGYLPLFHTVFVFFHPKITHIDRGGLWVTVGLMSGFFVLWYAVTFLFIKTVIERLIRGHLRTVESDARVADLVSEFIRVGLEWRSALGHYEMTQVETFYRGPVGDFTTASIPQEWRLMARARLTNPAIAPLLDRLENLSARLVSDPATADKVRENIGEHFCSLVSRSYDLVSLPRTDRASPLYQHTVELYRAWAGKK